MHTASQKQGVAPSRDRVLFGTATRDGWLLSMGIKDSLTEQPDGFA